MSIGINSGQYDQRIQIQVRSVGVDALGQESTTWNTVTTVWAQARPTRGRDFFAAGQQQTSIEVQFCIRYRVGIDPATCRVLWRDVPYEIVGEPVNVKGANVELELNCTRGVRGALQ